MLIWVRDSVAKFHGEPSECWTPVLNWHRPLLTGSLDGKIENLHQYYAVGVYHVINREILLEDGIEHDGIVLAHELGHYLKIEPSDYEDRPDELMHAFNNGGCKVIRSQWRQAARFAPVQQK